MAYPWAPGPLTPAWTPAPRDVPRTLLEEGVESSMGALGGSRNDLPHPVSHQRSASHQRQDRADLLEGVLVPVAQRNE
jgi:hypothetical protein